MNENTGELAKFATVKDVPLPAGWVSLPDELQGLADEAMANAAAGGKVAVVPLEGDSPLSQFRREQLARKAKAKAGNRKRNKVARKQRRA